MYFSKPSKAIDATAEILAQIERVTGTAVTADDIVVFEAAVANTRPLNKRGSIFHEGRMSEDMLRLMAQAVSTGTESVPLHTLHAQGWEMPIGKVFQATVVKASDGEAELHAMFYLPKSEASMVEKINLGIIDEVSVGVLSKQLLCSKCGYDYFGAEADFDNFYAQTCENEHTIGVDGAHVKLSGLQSWMELSLVSRGAANKPKILGRAKQVMGRDTYDRLAASARVPEALVLFTASDDKKEDESMNPEVKAQLDAFGTQLAQLTELVATLTPKEPTAEELAAAAAEAEAATLAAAEAEAAALAAAQISEQETALKAELEAAKARIAELEAATPAPKTEANLDTSGIPVGGVGASAIEDAKKGAVSPSLSAFKTPKR